MSARLLIECGVAETRAALIIGEESLRFWFGPARGDETLAAPPETGDVFLGRVRTISKPLRGAFVDLGEGPQGFLPFGGAGAPAAEGAAIIVMARRPALGGKGPVLTLDWKRGLSAEVAASLEKKAAGLTAPQRLIEPADAALQAVAALVPSDKAAEILVDSADAASLLRRAEPEAVISVGENLFEECGAEAALEESLERLVSLPGGARLVMDEAEALTVVDVDSGSMAEGASGRLNDKVNLAASRRLFAELSRRAIGGRVVVDFLPPSGAEARKALTDRLRQSAKGVYDCRFGKLSVDGVFDLTAPRERLSLIERASEAAGEGWARPGRRFTLDWRAKKAMRALEQGLRGRPAARFRLFAGRALAVYLGGRPQWTERLAARHSARFDIIMDDKLEERSFDLAEGR